VGRGFESRPDHIEKEAATSKNVTASLLFMPYLSHTVAKIGIKSAKIHPYTG